MAEKIVLYAGIDLGTTYSSVCIRNEIREEPKKHQVKIVPKKINKLEEQLKEEAVRINDLYTGKTKFWD